jgi:serine/threonine protein kinase
MPVTPPSEVFTGFATPEPVAIAREGALVERDLGPRYALRGFLARGGFATVWSVTDRMSGEELAVKRLDPRLGRRRDFYRELRAMFGVEHPNVVRIVNLLEAGGTRYLILELCRGGSLRAALSRARRAGHHATPDEARRLVAEVARGLAALHERGFTHRDLKPENVLFATRPHTFFGAPVKLADFGLTDTVAMGGGVLRGLTGSPAYMSPEQFSGVAVPASDVYALGVVAVELLTGDVPFLGTAEELAAHHLWTAPPLPGGLPSVLTGLLQAMLAKAPGDRPSAADVVAALFVPRGIPSESAPAEPPAPDAPVPPAGLGPINEVLDAFNW